MEIGGYRTEYLKVLHENFPFVDYVSKYTDLMSEKDKWTGRCPICEYGTIILKISSWHCKNCLKTADGVEPVFYSPEAFLAQFHRLDIFDAVCFLDGWVHTHTDAEIPKERYVYVESSPPPEAPPPTAEPADITDDKTANPGKPFDLETLLETTLPPSPHNIMRIYRLLRDFNAPVREITEAISYEPVLITRILRLANSPIYGVERNITSVQTAINTIGNRTLQDIVMMGLASATFSKTIGASSGARKIWEHSLAVGIIARELSAMLRIRGAEEVFTCGLLHDIGKLMLLSYDFQGFSDILSETDEKKMLARELQMYSHTHAEIGALVANRWSLQEELCSSIRYHHNPSHSNPPMIVTHIIEVADILANLKGYGVRGEEAAKLAELNSLKILRLTEEDLENAWTGIENSINETIRTFH